MLSKIKHFFETLLKPPLRDEILVSDKEVVRRISDGTIERVSWDDLRKVRIVTTDQGPYLEDVFFILEGSKDGVVITQEWATKLSLVDKLQELPAFDNQAFIAAMGCTDNNSFLVWSKVSA